MKMTFVGLQNAHYPFTSQAHRTVHAVKAKQIKQAQWRLISFFTLGGGVSQCSNSTILGSEQMSFQVSPKGCWKHERNHLYHQHTESSASHKPPHIASPVNWYTRGIHTLHPSVSSRGGWVPINSYYLAYCMPRKQEQGHQPLTNNAWMICQ